MNKLLVILSVAFVLLIAGCTMKKPVSIGCCIYNETTEQCDGLKDSGPETTFLGTNSCNTTATICNVSIKVTVGTAENTSDVSVPICSNASGGCLQGDCIAQLCGSLKYNPTPIPSYRDSQKFESEARDTGKVAAADEIRKESPVGLYGTTCRMYRTDDLLLNFLKNSKGSFINTFRLGVGSSFEEFDHYRWFFPLSDLNCNSNPVAGAKERYMNYLISPDEFGQKYSGAAYDKPDERVQNESFCLKDEVSPFRGPTYDGASMPDYRYYPVRRTADGIDYGEDFPQYVSVSFEHTQFDKVFYSNFLNLIYEKELSEGLESFAGIPTPAPFECGTSLDCASAY
ncbi:MAG: hypothetical protein AB1529_04360, partial [Candidatus Micrarchaeota archaeon]